MQAANVTFVSKLIASIDDLNENPYRVLNESVNDLCYCFV